MIFLKPIFRILVVKFSWKQQCKQPCLRLRPLSAQVGIQLFLHVIGHLPLYGAQLGIGHAAREGNEKINILYHLRSLHELRGIIAVMNGCRVIG